MKIAVTYGGGGGRGNAYRTAQGPLPSSRVGRGLFQLHVYCTVLRARITDSINISTVRYRHLLYFVFDAAPDDASSGSLPGYGVRLYCRDRKYEALSP